MINRIIVRETGLRLSLEVQSADLLPLSAEFTYQFNRFLICPVQSKKGERPLPPTPTPVGALSAVGRSNIRRGEAPWEDVALHHRTAPVLEECTSPHAAPFCRRHVAAVFAFEGFSELWEILESSQHPAGHEAVNWCCDWGVIRTRS